MFGGDSMSSRKYTKDYRIEPYLDRKGRLRDRAVYSGLYYTFCQDRREVQKIAWLLSALTLLATVTVVLPMCFSCDYFRRFYLVLPQAFLLLPLYFLWAAILRVFTAGEKVTQEHRDKIVNRIPSAGWAFLILSAVCAIGAVVYALIDAPHGADWLAGACSLARLIPALLLFLMRGKIQMENVPLPPAESEDEL